MEQEEAQHICSGIVGRPRKYFTAEERAAANREYVKKHNLKKRENAVPAKRGRPPKYDTIEQLREADLNYARKYRMMQMDSHLKEPVTLAEYIKQTTDWSNMQPLTSRDYIEDDDLRNEAYDFYNDVIRKLDIVPFSLYEWQVVFKSFYHFIDILNFDYRLLLPECNTIDTLKYYILFSVAIAHPPNKIIPFLNNKIKSLKSSQ